MNESENEKHLKGKTKLTSTYLNLYIILETHILSQVNKDVPFRYH